MKTNEIIRLEKNNQNSIFLIKKGCFWRAYEKSAFRFFTQVKEFQVIKKYIKCVNQEIIFLGFPVNLFDKIEEKLMMTNLEILQKKEGIVEIGKFFDEDDFLDWKLSMPQKNPKDYQYIIDLIKTFPTINKTPLEAINFIMKLQAEITIIN